MTEIADELPELAGEPILDLLNGFIGELREAGLPVSLTENLDAMAAIRHIPMEDREAFKYALAATLVKNNAHWRSFETVFEVYFSLRGAKYGIDDDTLDSDLADLLDDDERDGAGDQGEDQAEGQREFSGAGIRGVVGEHGRGDSLSGSGSRQREHTRGALRNAALRTLPRIPQKGQTDLSVPSKTTACLAGWPA